MDPLPQYAPRALACTVRGCGGPLGAADAPGPWSTLRCPRGHSFDRAREGYVNLLQPQDRRSLDAGDSAEAVAARARLLEAGAGLALFEALCEVVRGLGLGPTDTLVELGSGTGTLLTRLAAATGAACYGLDLSVAAARHAARVPAQPASGRCTWVVANADRRLPFADGAVQLVLSVHGRRNPTEVRRILAPGGRWLVAVPGDDDLAELRAAAQGSAAARARLAELRAEARAAGLEPLAEGSSRATVALDRALLADVCAGTYRGLRAAEAARVAALDGLAVTFHSEWLVATPVAFQEPGTAAARTPR